MIDQLVKLIEICLADGEIAEKERIAILKKAESLGISAEECDIIIDGITQRSKSVSILSSTTIADKISCYHVQDKPIEQLQYHHHKGNVYSWKIPLSEGKYVTVEFELGDNFMKGVLPPIDKVLASNCPPNFNKWDNFLNDVETKDDLFNSVTEIYRAGSILRKKKVYAGGDEYEGQLCGDIRCGIGQLKVKYEKVQDVMDIPKCDYILLRGVFEDNIFISGEIDVWFSESDYMTYEGVKLKNHSVSPTKLHYNCISYTGSDGVVYIGGIVNFRKHGKGLIRDEDGNEIHGEWSNDILTDKSREVSKSSIDLRRLHKDNKWNDIYEYVRAEIHCRELVADWEITSIYLESLLFVNRPKSELIKSAESVYSEIEDKSLMFGFMGQLYKKAGMLEKNIDYMKIAVDYYVLEKNVAEQHATRAFIVEMMAEGNHKDRFEKRTLLDVTVDKKFITGPKALFDKKTGFYRRDGHYFFTTIQIKVKDIASVERIYHNIYTYVFILSKTSKSIIISDGYKTDYSRIGRMGDDEELIKLIKSAMISANNI